MNLQHIVHSHVVLLLFAVGIFFILQSILLHTKATRYFYLSVAVCGLGLYTLFAIVLSLDVPPEKIVFYHRFRGISLIVAASAWFFYVYDIYFGISRIPKLFLGISCAAIATSPFNIFMSQPVNSVQVDILQSTFTYHFATPGPAYTLYVILAMGCAVACIVQVYRNSNPPVKKIYSLLACLPQIIAGIHDLSVINGIVHNITIFEYLTTLFVVFIFILEIVQEQQNRRQVQELNQKLEEKVRERTRGLEQTEARFRTIAETSPEAILITDAKGTIIFCNKATTDIFGYREDELMHNPVDILMTETQRRAYLTGKTAGFFGIYGQGPFASVAKRKDGTELPIELSLSHWAANELSYSSLIIRDISRRKAAEKALLESEERFRAIAETTPDAVVTADWQGNISFWNKGAENLFGYSREEALGRPANMLIPPQNNRDIPSELKAIADDEKLDEIEKTIEGPAVRKDGTIIPIEISRSLWITDEKITLCAIMRNISSAKQTEAQLQSYQQQLSSLTSELLLTEERERRNISTELHDRIGQVLILAKMKMGGVIHTAPEEKTGELGYVDSILEQTIEDTRSLTFEISPPILYDMGLEPALEWQLEQIKEHQDIETVFQSDDRDKPLSDTCKIVLFKAARELLFNVIKHARADKVLLSVLRVDSCIRITVSDNGVGFDSESRPSAGPGNLTFGHFSIRERMSHLGGTFHCTSTPGEGTQIDLVAPLELTATPSADSA